MNFENFESLDPEVMMEMESINLELEKDEELRTVLIADGLMDESNGIILEDNDSDNDLPF